MSDLIGQVVNAGIQTREHNVGRADLGTLLANLPAVSVLPWGDVLRSPYVGSLGGQVAVMTRDGSAPVVVAGHGSRYQAVGHDEIVQALATEADRRNLDSTFQVREFLGGARMAANVALPGATVTLAGGDEFIPSISAINSFDGGTPVSLFGGGNVRICANGNLWGDVVESFAAKHGSAKLAIENALGQASNRIFDALFGYLPQFQATVKLAAQKPLETPAKFAETFGIGPRVWERVWDRAVNQPGRNYDASTVWGLVQGVTAYARDLDRGAWTDDGKGSPSVGQGDKYRQIADRMLLTVRA